MAPKFRVSFWTAATNFVIAFVGGGGGGGGCAAATATAVASGIPTTTVQFWS